MLSMKVSNQQLWDETWMNWNECYHKINIVNSFKYFSVYIAVVGIYPSQEMMVSFLVFGGQGKGKCVIPALLQEFPGDTVCHPATSLAPPQIFVGFTPYPSLLSMIPLRLVAS